MTNYLTENELDRLYAIVVDDGDTKAVKFFLKQHTTKNKLTFGDLSEELRNNQRIILTVVRNDADILHYVSKELRNNKHFMLMVVQCNGCALKYASDELRNDQEVVLAAVKNDGQALVYASTELYNNRDIVLVAVQSNANVLGFASKKMCSDKEIVLAAIRNNSNALNNASPELLDDIEVVLTAVKSGYCYHKYDCNLCVSWATRLTYPNELIHEKDLMRSMWNLIHRVKDPIQAIRHIMEKKDDYICNCPLQKIYKDPELLCAFTILHGGNPTLIDRLLHSLDC